MYTLWVSFSLDVSVTGKSASAVNIMTHHSKSNVRVAIPVKFSGNSTKSKSESALAHSCSQLHTSTAPPEIKTTDTGM